ncbi:MAG: TIGR01212 family radical SAM protein [Deltaproteobacteria bacterium]|nr:TIGR01212 family radical SAM protein [Deltaproteobacteria bacterium]
MEHGKAQRYRPLSGYLMERFGCRVFRVSLDAGLTCPNKDGTKGWGGCSFCNSSTLAHPPGTNKRELKEQLLQGMQRLKERRRAEKFIAYLQPNSNTYAPIEFLEKVYQEAIDHPDVVALAISTRPDCLGEEALELLESFSRKIDLWIEVGFQTAKEETLTALNREHTVADFEKALAGARGRGIPLCAHVILGLPGESREDMVATARFLAQHSIWGVKIHPLHIQRGTRLEGLYRKGEVRVLGLDEYAERVVEFLEELPPQTIIHRLCGSTPRRFLVAPPWGADRFAPPAVIRQLLDARNSHQGARYIP